MKLFDIEHLTKGAKIHFIGIGGISMSGLAEILLGRGCIVSGSDISESAIVQRLRGLGAQISVGHSAANIKPDCDLVVYTAAISPENEEFIAAEESGALLIDRAALLGGVMKAYKYSVAVAGTHGKTSTTSMLTHIMLAGGTDPTISVGGELGSIGGNIRVGKSDYFVCEACEYHRSFLKFFPYVSVILNIEADHLDYFKDIHHIVDTFHSFALLVPEDGAVVANIDDENVREAVKRVDRKILTCAISAAADYTTGNVLYDEGGAAEFDLYERGSLLGRIKLSVAGTHNISNALCAIAAARFLGISFDALRRGLLSYTGVGRRFETKGEKNGVLLIDDYAHHPTEIEATLKTAKKMGRGNIWCVFQPHTYTRTKALFNDFKKALSCGVKVLCIDIYAAREKDPGDISAKQLAEQIDGAVYMPDFAACAKFLEENAEAGDMIITMGAGDVYKVGELFMECV